MENDQTVQMMGRGVRGGSGQIFQLAKGILIWTSLSEGEIDTMRWRCR